VRHFRPVALLAVPADSVFAIQPAYKRFQVADQTRQIRDPFLVGLVDHPAATRLRAPFLDRATLQP